MKLDDGIFFSFLFLLVMVFYCLDGIYAKDGGYTPVNRTSGKIFEFHVPPI